MSMNFPNIVSFSASLLSLTVLYSCQSTQQNVYQQASRSTSYSQTDKRPPAHQNYNQLFSEPAPAPTNNDFPPAAPPSLAPPQTNKQVNQKRSLILKTSQEEFADDQEYFKSEFSSGFDEPAQKHLGLVPHYSSVKSSVSQKVKQLNGKVKQMNGKVKEFCTSMKAHLKTPRWIRKVSGSHVEEPITDSLGSDVSCIESMPVLEQDSLQTAPFSPKPEKSLPVFPEPLHTHPQSKPLPLPLQPQPKSESKGLPRLPMPKQTTTYQENSWKVSASVEQMPVKNYSTLEDEIELWPYSKQRMLQEANVMPFRKIKTRTPVTTPRVFKNQVELLNPRESTVPSMLTQENADTIRKISLQRFQNGHRSKTAETLKQSPIVITPRKF